MTTTGCSEHVAHTLDVDLIFPVSTTVCERASSMACSLELSSVSFENRLAVTNVISVISGIRYRCSLKLILN